MTKPRHRYNWPLIFAVLIDVMVLALLSRNMMAAGIGLGLFLVSLLAPKFRLDRIGQVIFSLFTFVLSYVIVMVPAEQEMVIQEGAIGAYGTLFAFAFLLVAVIRFFLHAPYGGDAASAGLLFLSVLSMGSVAKGIVFPVGSTVMLIMLTLACRYRDPVRPSITDLGRQNTRVLLVIFSIFGIVFTGLIVGLPLAYKQAFKLLEANYRSARTGFSYVMGLGDLDGMLQSDSVVMRIYGPKPDHLRGMVYTRYINGRWLGSKQDKRRSPTLASKPIDSPTRVTIRLVGPDRDRYFLPINATDIWLRHQQRVVDSSGVLMVQSGTADEIAFTMGDKTGTASATPTSDHLTVPTTLRLPLQSVLDSWGIRTDRAANRENGLARVVRQLRRFEYSLSFKVPPDSDPVIAFLTATKKGHCEYFASAAALLARTLGIPARVVGGYRVHEKNPISGFYVVRERNAHAWVEVFLKGKWQTVDSTPSLEVFGAQPLHTPFGAAVAEAFASFFGRGLDRVSKLSPVELGGAVVSLLVVWAMVRLYRRRLRGHRSERRRRTRQYREPLPAFMSFLSRLERYGITLGENETIDGLAKRIEHLENPEFDQVNVSGLLRRYVAWRFGNQENSASVAGDLERWGR